MRKNNLCMKFVVLSAVALLGATSVAASGEQLSNTNESKCKDLVFEFIKHVHNNAPAKAEALFADPRNARAWVKDLKKARKRGRKVRVNLRIQEFCQDKVRTSLFKVRTKVSVTVNGHIDIQNNIWVFHIVNTGNKYIIEEIDCETVRKHNQFMGNNRKVSKLLTTVIAMKDYRQLAELFGVASKQTQKQSDKELAAALRKTGAGLFVQAMDSSGPRVSIHDVASSSSGKDVLLVKLEVRKAEGRYAGKVLGALQVSCKLPPAESVRIPFHLKVVNERLLRFGTRSAHNFWAACLMAKGMVLVSVEEKKKVLAYRPREKPIDRRLRVLGSLAVDGYAEVSLEHIDPGRSLQVKLRTPGTYILPVMMKEKNWVVVPGDYNLPKVTSTQGGGLYVDALARWHKADAKQGGAFLLGIVLNSEVEAVIKKDAISALSTTSFFAERLSPEEATTIRRLLSQDSKLDQASQSLLVMGLSGANFQQFREDFVAILLRNPEVRFSPVACIAARCLRMHDSKRFGVMLLEWLGDKSKRHSAIRAGMAINLFKDAVFSKKVADSFDVSNGKYIKECLPYLLNPKNEAGLRQVSGLLRNSKDAKVLGFILNSIKANQHGVLCADVTKFLRRGSTEKEFLSPRTFYLMAHAMAFLCAGRNATGLQACLSYIDHVGTFDEQMKSVAVAQITSMLSRQSGRLLRNIAECKAWIKTGCSVTSPNARPGSRRQ